MIGTVYDRATGEILWTVDGSADIVAAQDSDTHGVVDGALDGGATYIRDGAPADRPHLNDVPAKMTLDVDEAWTIAAPARTVVKVDGETAGEIGPGVPLQFDSEGVYAVALLPPFPWRPAACTVTVK